MKLKYTLTLSTLVISSLISGCSKDKSGTRFGAPNIAAIVDASVPNALKTSSASNNKLWNRLGPISAAYAAPATCTSKNGGGGSSTSTCSTAADYISFVRDEVFQKVSGVAAPQYYRYWVDVLDTAMSETDGRIASNDEAPACLSQTPVDVAFSFNINGQAVTVTEKLQCWEQQTAPGAATQNMAFGKDSDHFYLVYRTDDNALTSGSGERYLIAKASADGNSAEIWFVGASCQTGGGCSSRSQFNVNAQRVLANKTSGAFTFNSVEYLTTAQNMIFGDFFANSNGTNIYLEAAFGSGGSMTDVSGMTSAGNGASNCVLASTLATAASTDCASIGRSGMPSNFGLTAPMRNRAPLWQADDTARGNFLTALQAISDIDYSAQGVGKFQ